MWRSLARVHTSGAKARFRGLPMRAKAEALGYLDAKTTASATATASASATADPYGMTTRKTKQEQEQVQQQRQMLIRRSFDSLWMTAVGMVKERRDDEN